MLLRVYTKTIPELLGTNAEIQILAPMLKGTLATHNSNSRLQDAVNAASSERGELRMGAKLFRVGDRVIQTLNNYDLNVFNGDTGQITNIDIADMQCEVAFSNGKVLVHYEREQMMELQLAYTITIHRSQSLSSGCESDSGPTKTNKFS